MKWKDAAEKARQVKEGDGVPLLSSLLPPHRRRHHHLLLHTLTLSRSLMNSSFLFFALLGP